MAAGWTEQCSAEITTGACFAMRDEVDVAYAKRTTGGLWVILYKRRGMEYGPLAKLEGKSPAYAVVADEVQLGQIFANCGLSYYKYDQVWTPEHEHEHATCFRLCKN